MAAYSAVVSLEQLLNQVLNSDRFPKEELFSLHEKISSLKSSLETIFPAPKNVRDEANKLAIKIREKIFKVQDTIEYSIFFNQSLPSESPETSKSQSSTSISLEEIIADIDPTTEKMKRLGNSSGEVKKDSQPVDESQTFKSSDSWQTNKIVGQKEYKELIEKKLMSEVSRREVIPICGMSGIGKTTLAKSIYDDATIKEQFKHRAWVTVSQDANVGDILAKLLNNLETSTHKARDRKYKGDEAELQVELHQALYHNKYLVVIDDICDQEIWAKLQIALPDNENQSRVLLTTRSSKVSDSVKSTDGLELKPLSDVDSWTLLRIKAFGDNKKRMPTELENIGKKIAMNCEGLPLSLTVIGELLSQKNDSTDYWQIIEDDIYAGQSREKVVAVQDTVDLNQGLTSISLEQIIAYIDPISKEAKRLGDSIREVKKDSQPVDESRTFKSSVSGQSNKIVGQDEYKKEIEGKLMADVSNREVIPICGMAGIGKTTLAKSIYNDATIREQFMYRAWVTVSEDDNIGEILLKLLKTLESSARKAGDKVYGGPEEKLKVELHQALYGNIYLVVIDDMWNPDILKTLLNTLPDNGNRSRVLLTTRILDVAKSVNKDFSLVMKPLSDVDSWTLLRNKTFGDDKACPAELENIGKKIATNCKGLPISLLVIGGLLSQGSKGTSYWRSIEEDTYAATHDVKLEESYSKILSLSYDLLPCEIKACFLYMAAFPEDSDIPVSKLIRLWVAEGFLAIQPAQLVEKAAEKSLLDLIDRNLVLIKTYRSNGGIRSCGMHDSLRDLAEMVSRKDMFFHLRKRDSLEQVGDRNSQRRVSVHKNILMCRANVYDSTKTITKARSVLYVDPHHPHPMPFSLTFDLLRVLDAFSVFFLQFPDEILELIHLRYLSFTYNGKLPSKIAKLHKLQVLIVKRQPKIIYVGAPFLPVEIWNMKELRHLLITESDLPLLSPTLPGSILLENLQTLLNVNAASCTEEVLGHMPNLKRLGMWIEEAEEVGLYLNKLDKLEIFKFIVLNPSPRMKIEFQPKLFFPDTVRKLYLSGCGLPWEDMKVIEQLPNLEVLKLKELAFHGEEWKPTYKFLKLKYLLIEYLNLKRWKARPSCFPRLEQLFFRHCYELEGIPSGFGALGYIRVIELVDCSRKAVESAKFIEAKQKVFKNERLQVRTYSSWE